MRTTFLTAFGKVATDWVRLTAVILEDGSYVLRRADGTNTVVDVLPTTWRTSGDISSVVATLGHKVNMASVPSVGLPNHAWKGTFDLFDIALHMAPNKAAAEAVVTGLMVTYMSDEELAAA